MPGEIPDVYLRFAGYTGSCQDVDHPGKDGWIGIKNLTFGFGFPGKDQGTANQTATVNQDKDKAKDKQGKTPQASTTPKTKGSTSGPLTFDPVSFSKGSDLMSVDLMKACRWGTKIAKVDFEACRSGGLAGDQKVPFVQMTFEEVYLKTCKLNLASEGLPDETIEFTYEKVTMKALWTDNTTGKKLGETMIVTWKMSDGEATNQ